MKTNRLPTQINALDLSQDRAVKLPDDNIRHEHASKSPFRYLSPKPAFVKLLTLYRRASPADVSGTASATANIRSNANLSMGLPITLPQPSENYRVKFNEIRKKISSNIFGKDRFGLYTKDYFEKPDIHSFLKRVSNKKEGFQPGDYIFLMHFFMKAIQNTNVVQVNLLLPVFKNILNAPDIPNSDKHHIVRLLERHQSKNESIQALTFEARKVLGNKPQKIHSINFNGSYGFELEYVGPNPLFSPGNMIRLVKDLHGIKETHGIWELSAAYSQPEFEPDGSVKHTWKEYSHELVTQVLRENADVSSSREIMHTLKLLGCLRTKKTGDHMHIGAKDDAIKAFKARHPQTLAEDGIIQKRFIQSLMIAFTHTVPEWNTVSKGDKQYHRFNWRPWPHRVGGFFIPYAAKLYKIEDDAKNRTSFIQKLDSTFDQHFDKMLEKNTGRVISELQFLRHSLINLNNLPERGGKVMARPKKTVEIRGLEHWLWKRMPVEPQILDTYLGYINDLCGIALDMAKMKIDNPDESLASLIQEPDNEIGRRIVAAAKKLQHDVTLATFRAALTDYRITERDNTEHAMYVLNRCFQYNPKSFIGKNHDSHQDSYPLLNDITFQDFAELAGDIKSTPTILRRLSALDTSLKMALGNKIECGLAHAHLPDETHTALLAWRNVLLEGVFNTSDTTAS